MTPVSAPPSQPLRWRWALLLAVTPVLRWLVLRLAVSPAEAQRTTCAGCGAALRPDGPGWLALTPLGRCGRCHTAVGAAAWSLEAVFVAAIAVAVAVDAPAPVRLATLWWLCCAVPLLFVDLRVHRLPDALTGPAFAGVVALFAAQAAYAGQWSRLGGALSVAAVTGAAFVATTMVLGRRGLGLGDAKLIVSVAVLLGWWGWTTVFTAVFLGFLFAGVVGALLLAAGRAQRGSHIAMGPFFIAGATATLALLASTMPV